MENKNNVICLHQAEVESPFVALCQTRDQAVRRAARMRKARWKNTLRALKIQVAVLAAALGAGLWAVHLL